MGELKAKHLQQENKELEVKANQCELKAKQLEQENKALQENKELHLGLTGYQVCVRVGLCVLQRNKTVCVRVAEQSGVFASSVCISVYMLYSKSLHMYSLLASVSSCMTNACHGAN
jgi:hypothetical protein